MNTLFLLVLSTLLVSSLAFAPSPAKLGTRKALSISMSPLDVMPIDSHVEHASLTVAAVDQPGLLPTLVMLGGIGVIFISSLLDFLKQFDKPRKENGF